jgi:curved DNA-binding protein CbpA
LKNYYKILEAPSDSLIRDIRKAYRKRSYRVTPLQKKSPTAEDEFIEITEAYTGLKHASSKAQYDKLYAYSILRKSTLNETKSKNR